MSRSFSPGGDLLTLGHVWSGGGVTFGHGYERTHRLTSLTVTDQRFSPVMAAPGTTGYTPDRLNRYSTVGGVALTYDAASNLTSDGVFTFGYDAENRLVSAASPSLNAVYAYDPLGRRVGKAVNGVSSGLLSAGQDEIALYQLNGALLRRWVPGPAIDRPLVEVDAGTGAVAHYRQDRLGSTIAMTNASGALVEGPYAYDPYGRPNLTTGTPFKYAGRRHDPETGLYYNRARFYSPALGRFLQTDPIGYDDGLNLYAYVGNDPVNRTDPTGMVGNPLTELAEQVARRAIVEAARRTAVRQAWTMERRLVRETGAGTREWTASQSRELLSTGRVRGFTGHHIRDVQNHAADSGNPDNINFLTPAEHGGVHAATGGTRGTTSGDLIDRTAGGTIARPSAAPSQTALMRTLSGAYTAVQVLSLFDPIEVLTNPNYGRIESLDDALAPKICHPSVRYC